VTSYRLELGYLTTENIRPSV